jgi:hypothetical protein
MMSEFNFKHFYYYDVCPIEGYTIFLLILSTNITNYLFKKSIDVSCSFEYTVLRIIAKYCYPYYFLLEPV